MQAGCSGRRQTPGCRSTACGRPPHRSAHLRRPPWRSSRKVISPKCPVSCPCLGPTLCLERNIAANLRVSQDQTGRRVHDLDQTYSANPRFSTSVDPPRCRRADRRAALRGGRPCRRSRCRSCSASPRPAADNRRIVNRSTPSIVSDPSRPALRMASRDKPARCPALRCGGLSRVDMA